MLGCFERLKQASQLLVETHNYLNKREQACACFLERLICTPSRKFHVLIEDQRKRSRLKTATIAHDRLKISSL